MSWNNLHHINHDGPFEPLDLPAIADEIQAKLLEAEQAPDSEKLGAVLGNLPHPAMAGAVVTRKNQATMPQTEKDAFKAAVEKMVGDGQYESLVLAHLNGMAHRMHSSQGFAGMLRFLPWHRQYLIAFERDLQAADLALRGDQVEPLGIPYWRWIDPFPQWLDGWLPMTPVPQFGIPTPDRDIGGMGTKPNSTDVEQILTDFANHSVPPIPQMNDYIRFSLGLEGNVPGLRAHNHVHNWVGGIMRNPMASPTDPVFWMHHAEVDRLWAIWQIDNDSHPPLTGADRTMDPWAASYDDLIIPEQNGYTYESMDA